MQFLQVVFVIRILCLDGFTTRDLVYSWNDEFVSYARDKEAAQFALASYRYLNGTRTYATGEACYGRKPVCRSKVAASVLVHHQTGSDL